MQIKGNDSIIEINILSKSYPKSENEWDAKWLSIELIIKLNGFKSNQHIQFFTDDLLDFSKSIEDSLADFSKPIELKSVEDCLNLEGKIIYNGNIEWKGYTIYPVGSDNKLSFRFITELGGLDRFHNELQKELNALK